MRHHTRCCTRYASPCYTKLGLKSRSFRTVLFLEGEPGEFAGSHTVASILTPICNTPRLPKLSSKTIFPKASRAAAHHQTQVGPLAGEPIPSRGSRLVRLIITKFTGGSDAACDQGRIDRLARPRYPLQNSSRGSGTAYRADAAWSRGRHRGR